MPADATPTHLLWAIVLGAISAVSLPLGSWVGLNVRFELRQIALFAAFGAGALIAALSVELVAPTAMALTGPAAESAPARAAFLALIVGGVLGGALFVALDSIVNQHGGHVRKTSTTLAHLAARRRDGVRALMERVLAVRPFDALPRELTETLAGMLRPVEFTEGQTVPLGDPGPGEAYVVLEGELDVQLAGKPSGAVGAGSILGVLTLVVPGLASLGTATARTASRCLALTRDDVARLRALAPAFDQACRELASERAGELERHLVTRLAQAVEWSRATASALRLGTEVPALALRRAHDERHGSPLAVWLGILLDGIPESIVIGAGLFLLVAEHPAAETLRFAQVIPYTLVAGLFLSNFPEALSSSANMLAEGWTRRRVFLMWLALMATTAVGAGLGFLLAGALSETWLVFAEGVAAGAMLTMIAAAMIPEAAAHGRPNAVGLGTLAGFLAAILFKLLE